MFLSASIQLQEQHCQRTSVGSKIGRLLAGKRTVPTLLEKEFNLIVVSECQTFEISKVKKEGKPRNAFNCDEVE